MHAAGVHHRSLRLWFSPGKPGQGGPDKEVAQAAAGDAFCVSMSAGHTCAQPFPVYPVPRHHRKPSSQITGTAQARSNT